MTATAPAIIELTEHRPLLLPAQALPYTVGEAVHRKFRKQVTVEFPTPVTDHNWRLTAGGWVGYLPILPGWGMALRPKVPIGNLFRMLDYAYRLDFRFLQGAYDSQSLDEFFEVLAGILARRILERGRRGYYRAYIGRTEPLGYVRGRINILRMAAQPTATRPWCAYAEHTADVQDNQILAWTLQVIARSGLCTERVRPLVRRAFHALQSFASLIPFTPADCADRAYNRLNEDYAPLHRLSRFFLEHTGPHHVPGGTPMLPFVIDMDRLFELFVAEWLRLNLPAGHTLKSQEAVDFAADDDLSFRIDLQLFRPDASSPWCVLDTKYKWPEKASPADVQQAVTYAEAMGCTEAFLIYPAPLPRPLDVQIGRIRVRSLVFDLQRDIDEAGQAVIQSLGISEGQRLNGDMHKLAVFRA